jgi:hypothetical protein
LPLISKGAKIRIWFDGWPTIVFSGWPDMSYGTFEAELLPLKNSLVIMENSEYLLLTLMRSLAKTIKYGSGAQTIALLNTVPVWFEYGVHLTGSHQIIMK